MQPFLSIGVYKVLQIVGTVLSVVFAILVFLVNLSQQQHRMRRDHHQQLIKEEQPGTIHTPDIQENHYSQHSYQEDTWNSSKSSIFHPTLQLIGPPACTTICFVVLSIGVATLHVALLMLGILLSIIVVGCHYYYPSSQQNNNNFSTTTTTTTPPSAPDPTSAMRTIALVASVAILAGSTSLAFHANSMIPLATDISYLGPMRVVGFSNSVQHTSDCSAAVTNVGVIQVAWGGTWGCPLFNNISYQCTSFVDSFFCDYIVCNGKCTCSEAEYQTAKEKSQSCLESRYNATLVLIDKGNKYDPNVAPGHDGWQSHVMYGDCSTCKAQFDFVFNVDHTQIKIGRFNTITYYSFGFVFGIQLVRMWMKKRRQTSQNDNVFFFAASKSGVAA